MPKTSDMLESKFIKKTDIGPGQLWTIANVAQVNVARDDEDQELKWCLNFKEIDKPMVLNVTNIRLLEHICGSDDTDKWINKQVVIYFDPTVMYAGEVKGGLRVRAPKTKEESDLPF